MPKYNVRKLSSAQREALLRRLFQAVAVLKNYREASDFFRDLLDPAEIGMLARRLEIAALIHDGLTYDEIARKLGAGRDTIARVARWYHEGHGGYKVFVQRTQGRLKS